jgi:hypothetical protein
MGRIPRTTLFELIEAVREVVDDPADTVRVVEHLLATRKVRIRRRVVRTDRPEAPVRIHGTEETSAPRRAVPGDRTPDG